MTKSIMIQGTGSNIGKSLLVAGLARACVRRGLTVAPFKPQNMSNNAAVTVDGGEIGRAQALQAFAARREPVVDMNPVLLKPETETGAQVIVQGKRLTSARARDYARLKPTLLAAVLESFHRLSQSVDLVLVEGAGSPAEINLRKGDIANMGFAEAAGVPVILAGDIHRGGVIAQIVGTHSVLPTEDRARIAACLINKFRGDVSLFDDGVTEIETRTGWPVLGVIPWFERAHLLPAEDAVDIAGSQGGPIKIVVPLLSRIANFDDLDPLKAEPGVTVEMIAPGPPLPGDATLVILPGSKSTIGDLAFFRAQGWDIDLAAHIRRGGHVLGICGGYQMLGRTLSDPHGIEGPAGTVSGLGHLDVATGMTPEKHLTRVSGKAFGVPLQGYEIHIGQTDGPDRAQSWVTLDNRKDGAASADGRIMGTYLHGIFASDAFRAAYLARLGGVSDGISYEARVDTVLDDLARHLEDHLDIDALLKLAK